MSIKKRIIGLAVSILMTTNLYANDINSSWDIRTLKAQAYSETVKTAQKKKFTQIHTAVNPDKDKPNAAKAASIKMIFLLFN